MKRAYQMNETIQNNNQNNNYNRVSMEPLYQRLLKKPFNDSVSAIEYCRNVCAEFGFTVKQEASANRNIYVYCSREGLPDSLRNPKPLPQRKRPSKRCDCRWRVVLSENEGGQWEFRKSMNPTAAEHNHAMMSPDDMVKAWPPQVNAMIIHLARQRLQTHEIRERVKHQFPDIAWNERRFYNRLTEERKRMRQRGVVDRTQRLLKVSTRLCSLVAHQENWCSEVEHDLAQMKDHFCQLARFDSLIQPQWDLFADQTQKREAVPKGIQVVHIPSYHLQIYTPPLDSSPSSSSCSDSQPQAIQQSLSPHPLLPSDYHPYPPGFYPTTTSNFTTSSDLSFDSHSFFPSIKVEPIDMIQQDYVRHW